MLRIGVIILLSVYVIDSSTSAVSTSDAAVTENILKTLDNKANDQSYAKLSAEQATRMFEERPELTVFHNLGDGISYGYWRLKEAQYFRIVALSALTARHRSILDSIKKFVRHDRRMFFSIKSIGGEHGFFKDLSDSITKSLQGPARGKFEFPPAQLTTLLLPFDFCASACVALIASLNKYGKAIAFQDESNDNCPTAKFYVHASAYRIGGIGDFWLSFKSIEGTKKFNTSMGIDKIWFEANAGKFESLTYSELLPNELSGSKIISDVSDEIAYFAKFPTLPVDHVTIVSPNDKNLSNVSLVEVFASKIAAWDLEQDLQNKNASLVDKSQLERLMSYTKNCKSIDPQAADLGQLGSWHSEYYDYITEILKKSAPENNLARINLSF